MKKLIIPDFSSLKNQLDQIPLDTDTDIFLLDWTNFNALLFDFLDWRLTNSELENIANLLESKDGVSFENEYIKESIHKIANIDIQWVEMSDLVKGIIEI